MFLYKKINCMVFKLRKFEWNKVLLYNNLFVYIYIYIVYCSVLFNIIKLLLIMFVFLKEYLIK